jgi:uncharacterized protein HemY
LDPEGHLARDNGWAWIIGPSAEALAVAASEHTRQGLADLGDAAMPPAERLRAYRAHLLAAEELWVDSLRAQPAQSRVVAQLAAVRWELDPPLSEEARTGYRAVIDLASSMAPTIPAVHRQLGELLLKMDDSREAMAYFRNCIELRPRMSQEIVALLRDHLYTASEIRASLAARGEALVSLQTAFFEDGAEAEFLEALGTDIAESGNSVHPDVLSSYATAALRIGEPKLAHRTMEELGVLDDPATEASRLLQKSRASLALGDLASALADAAAARSLRPNAARFVEHLARVHAQSGNPSGAVKVLREVLAVLAHESPDPATRARIYRKIGQAEEGCGRPGRAYEAYRIALELDADEQFAGKRVAEMEADAGLGPDL